MTSPLEIGSVHLILNGSRCPGKVEPYRESKSKGQLEFSSETKIFLLNVKYRRQEGCYSLECLGPSWTPSERLGNGGGTLVRALPKPIDGTPKIQRAKVARDKVSGGKQQISQLIV